MAFARPNYPATTIEEPEFPTTGETISARLQRKSNPVVTAANLRKRTNPRRKQRKEWDDRR